MRLSWDIHTITWITCIYAAFARYFPSDACTLIFVEVYFLYIGDKADDNDDDHKLMLIENARIVTYFLFRRVSSCKRSKSVAKPGFKENSSNSLNCIFCGITRAFAV